MSRSLGESRSAAAVWAPVLAWAILILLVSGDLFAGETTRDWLVGILRRIGMALSRDAVLGLHFVIRKAAHVTEYLILALLVDRALRRGGMRPRLRVVWTLVIALGLAVLDEGRQALTTVRSGAIEDVALDGAGAVLGIVVARAIFRMPRRTGWRGRHGVRALLHMKERAPSGSDRREGV